MEASGMPEQTGPTTRPEPVKVKSEADSRASVARRPVHIAFTGILTVIGAAVGNKVAESYLKYLSARDLVAGPGGNEGLAEAFQIICITIIGMLLGFLLASVTFRQIAEVVPRIEQMSLEDKIAGLLGVVLGLVIAVLLSPLVKDVPNYGGTLVFMIYIFAVPLAVMFMISMKQEMVGMFASGGGDHEEGADGAKRRAQPKLVDTSVVIDGRILDIWHSGFLEGELLLPQFVLEELQTIADSADDLKRARGRRGLDLLNRIKDEVPGFKILRSRDYPPLNDAEGVDGKLLRLAAHFDAALLTNDHNLNLVADVQGVPVLNVNRLTLALKPVVLANEEMTVHVIRPGRDPGQGVAYLDDGTMVVVEDGESEVGRTVDVVVTSLLQTVAGKMIFAELKRGNGGGSRSSRGGR